jgi:hypothetical protein
MWFKKNCERLYSFIFIRFEKVANMLYAITGFYGFM